MESRGGGSVGNNLQMKNNPFRSNAISGRADGQTEVCSAVWLQREGAEEDGKPARV